MAKVEIVGVVQHCVEDFWEWAELNDMEAGSSRSFELPVSEVVEPGSGHRFFVRADLASFIERSVVVKGELSRFSCMVGDDDFYGWEVLNVEVAAHELLAQTRIDLNVPYAQKDVVKAEGARWDSGTKCWYVPAGVAFEKFFPWMSNDEQSMWRSTRFEVARSQRACWKCSETTDVFCFILPAGSMRSRYWETEETFLSYVTEISGEVEQTLRKFTSLYKPDYSKTTNSRYYMNHCSSCGMKQGDFMLHSEPGEPFCPISPEGYARIERVAIPHPFVGAVE